MGERLKEMVRTSTRGSFILLAGHVGGTVILAVGTLFVARLLGDTSYGNFNKALSVVHFVNMLVNLGVSVALTRFIALYKSRGEGRKIRMAIKVGIAVGLTVSLVMSLVVYFTSDFIANEVFAETEQAKYLRYLSVSIIGTAMMTISNGIIIGYEKMKYSSIQTILYSLVKSVTSPLLIYLGWDTLGAIIGHTIPLLLGGSLGFHFVSKIYNEVELGSESISFSVTYRTLLAYGYPLYLSSILGGIFPHLYTMLLGVNVTSDILGNYSAALNFVILISFVTMPINTTIFPLFAKLGYRDPELNFLYRNAVKYSTLFAFPIIVAVTSLADQMIEVLLGDKWNMAATFLRLYFLRFVYIGLGSGSSNILINSQNSTDVVFRINLIRFLVTLPMCFWIIPRYGVQGLLYMEFFIGGLITLLELYFVDRLYGYHLDMNLLFKVSIISMVCYVSVYSVVDILVCNPWVELVFGGFMTLIIYLVGFIVFKVFSVQNLIHFKRLAEDLVS